MLTPKPKTFISHAWEDKSLAMQLERELGSAKVDVWIDHSEIRGGDNLPKRINDALEWCNTFLLIWSEAASKSRWVELEWTNALSLDKVIIPCRLDKTPLPAILANKTFIDFLNTEKGLLDLLRVLSSPQERIEPLSLNKPLSSEFSVKQSGEINDNVADIPKFDVPTAQKYAREGRLEEWIHSYLNRPDPRANLGLSVGLKRKQRWWNGPLEMKLAELNRCEGPEVYMEYSVDPYYWAKRTTEMANSLTQLLDIPPLIVHCGTGFYLSIRDGNARHEAMRLKGWQACWVIIWYDTATDYRRHTKRLVKAGYLCNGSVA